MPDTVLVHIGCVSGPFITTFRPPEWMEYLVRQYFTFNDGNLYILTDRENVPHLPQHDKVVPVALEDYYSDKIDRLHAVYENAVQNYWTAVIDRFVYLENFLRDNDLRHIYHFDNDVLLYFNLADHHDTFQRLCSGMAITLENSKQASGGFMYIDGCEALACVTNFFIGEWEQCGGVGLREKYDVGMITEMMLLAAYKEGSKGQALRLPIAPFGESSWHFNEFGSIFDPISWGQFIDGTPHGHPQPVRFPHAHIGRMLIANPEYTVVWKTEEGLLCPYFSYDGNLVKINNLHIHSKNLSAFMSRDA